MTDTSSPTDVHPTITMLNGEQHTLPSCENVLDIKIQACMLFPENHPPQVRVLDEESVLLEDDEQDAPAFCSVLFCNGDHSDQNFWKAAVRAYAKRGANERASLAMPKT